MNEFPQSPADIIERIMQTAKSAVPDSLSKEMRNNVKAALQDVIADLDVVSRDELDIQKEVLRKTRAKVDEMEKVIQVLEARLNIEWKKDWEVTFKIDLKLLILKII